MIIPIIGLAQTNTNTCLNILTDTNTGLKIHTVSNTNTACRIVAPKIMVKTSKNMRILFRDLTLYAMGGTQGPDRLLFAIAIFFYK